MTSIAAIQIDVEGDLTRFRKDIDGAGDYARRELGDVDVDPGETQRSGERFGKKFYGAAAAVGGGILLGEVLDEAFAYDDLGFDIAAQLGLDAATEEAKRYGEIAGDLYAGAWGESLDEVGNAVVATVTSIEDLDPSGVERITERALAMADAFDNDVNEILGTTSTLIGSGLVSSAEEGLDVLAAAFQKVPVALRGEIQDAAIEYSQFFQALGFDARTAFGVLVAGAEDGQYGIDKAGDAIKEFTIRATDMSSASTAAYEAIGLDAQQMAEDLIAGGATAKGAFGEIVDGILSIEDPVERANTAIALFGTPLEDLGVNEIPEFLARLQDVSTELGEVDGAAQQTADTLSGKASAQWETFKREGMQVVAQFAATTLLPVMTAVFEIFTALPEPVQQLIGVFAAVGIAFQLLSGIMAVNPYVLLLAATVALAIAVIQNWDTISEKISTVASAIGGWINDYIIGPVSDVVGWFGRLPENADKAWELLKQKTGEAVDFIKRKLGELRDAADRMLGPIDEILGAAGRLGGGIISTGASLLGFDDGGVVPGPTGAPRLVLAHAGETILPTHKDPNAGVGGGDVYNVSLHDATIRNEDDILRLARMLADETRRSKRAQGVRS